MKLYFYVAIKVIFVHSIADGLHIMETVGVAFQEVSDWLTGNNGVFSRFLEST